MRIQYSLLLGLTFPAITAASCLMPTTVPVNEVQMQRAIKTANKDCFKDAASAAANGGKVQAFIDLVRKGAPKTPFGNYLVRKADVLQERLDELVPGGRAPAAPARPAVTPPVAPPARPSAPVVPEAPPLTPAEEKAIRDAADKALADLQPITPSEQKQIAAAGDRVTRPNPDTMSDTAVLAELAAIERRQGTGSQQDQLNDQLRYRMILNDITTRRPNLRPSIEPSLAEPVQPQPAPGPVGGRDLTQLDISDLTDAELAQEEDRFTSSTPSRFRLGDILAEQERRRKRPTVIVTPLPDVTAPQPAQPTPQQVITPDNAWNAIEQILLRNINTASFANWPVQDKQDLTRANNVVNNEYEYIVDDFARLPVNQRQQYLNIINDIYNRTHFADPNNPSAGYADSSPANIAALWNRVGELETMRLQNTAQRLIRSLNALGHQRPAAGGEAAPAPQPQPAPEPSNIPPAPPIDERPARPAPAPRPQPAPAPRPQPAPAPAPQPAALLANPQDSAPFQFNNIGQIDAEISRVTALPVPAGDADALRDKNTRLTALQDRKIAIQNPGSVNVRTMSPGALTDAQLNQELNRVRGSIGENARETQLNRERIRRTVRPHNVRETMAPAQLSIDELEEELRWYNTHASPSDAAGRTAQQNRIQALRQELRNKSAAAGSAAESEESAAEEEETEVPPARLRNIESRIRALPASSHTLPMQQFLNARTQRQDDVDLPTANAAEKALQDAGA